MDNGNMGGVNNYGSMPPTEESTTDNGRTKLIWLIVAGVVVVAIIGAIIYWAVNQSVVKDKNGTAGQGLSEEQQARDLDMKLGPANAELPTDYPTVVPAPYQNSRLQHVDVTQPAGKDSPDRTKDYMANYNTLGSLKDVYNYYLDAFTKSKDLTVTSKSLNPTNASISANSKDSMTNINVNISEMGQDGVVNVMVDTMVQALAMPTLK